MRVAILARSQGWPVLEAYYQAANLSLLEGLTPKPKADLLLGYLNLGRQLAIVGPQESAPSIFQRAIDNSDQLLGSSELSAAMRKQINSIRLVGLNELGWSLIVSQRYRDSITPLMQARDGWLMQRADPKKCDKTRKEDIELATTDQNLADANLAVGNFEDAYKYAHEAVKCRVELGSKHKILESEKSEGFALIYLGDEAAGKALLQKYNDSIRGIRDDDILPEGDKFISGAIIAGKFVPVSQFINSQDKYRSEAPSGLNNTPGLGREGGAP
ncbi:MAG: hypothetical protein FJX48_11265 [Alphaproteobacteria bacterium]|nr:hypothetical protein [Alphaproteobacteria bacterium]